MGRKSRFGAAFGLAVGLAVASGCSVVPAGAEALGRPIAPAICGPMFIPSIPGPGFQDEYCGGPMFVAWIAGAALGLPASLACAPITWTVGAVADKPRLVLLPSAITGYAAAYAVGAPWFVATIPSRIDRAMGRAPPPPERGPHPGCCDRLAIGPLLVRHEPHAGLDQALYEALGRPETAAGAEEALRWRATAVPLLRKSGLEDPARAAAARRILGEK